MKKRKSIFHRIAAVAAAVAIGVTTYVPTAFAETTNVKITYTWNSKVNPYISTKKEADDSGIEGQYIKAYEQICRFKPSTSDDYVFCVEPARNMKGSGKTELTQSGFTEGTPDEVSNDYWSDNFEGDYDLTKYIGLVQYYGYDAHKDGDYYAATQLLIWELVLGYRGHNRNTFASCSDVLWNDFTYPDDSWCTEDGVSAAYNDIVNNVNAHYSIPSGLYSNEGLAQASPYLMKYNASTEQYEATITIASSLVNASSLRNYSSLKTQLENTVKDKFLYGTYGTDYGVSSTTSGTNTIYTVWSKNRPLSGTVLSGSVSMSRQNNSALKNSLFTSPSYQTCLYDSSMDPARGYFAIAAYNEPNLIVSKTYKDGAGITVSGDALEELIGQTGFVIYTYIDNTKYYVIADEDTENSAYNFKRYTTVYNDSTGFKCLWKANDTKWQIWVYDLPTAESGGRKYYIEEYKVPSDRYTKQWTSITLPSPSASSYSTNAGDKYASITNEYRTINVPYTSTFLTKDINNNGEYFDMTNADDVDKLSDIYKKTKFIIGYWGLDNGTPVLRFFTKAFRTADEALRSDQDIKNYSFYNDVKDITYTRGDGCYFLPFYITGSGDTQNVQFNFDFTSTSPDDAFVFETGYNHTGTDVCSYFGQIYLNLLPLDGDAPKNIFFIEIDSAENYGYQSGSTEYTFDDVLSTPGDEKKNISGVLHSTLPGTGVRQYHQTAIDEDGNGHSITSTNFYPIVGLNNNTSSYVQNVRYHFQLELYKRDSETNETLTGAEFGLYDADKNLLATSKPVARSYYYFDYDLVPGKDYYYKELKAPAGYVRDTEFHKFNRELANYEAGDIREEELWYSSVDVPNTPMKGAIEVRKYDVINGIPIEGITFDITEKSSGTVIGSMTTDSDGVATYNDLPLGKLVDGTFEKVYTVTEQEDEVYMMLNGSGEITDSFEAVYTENDILDDTDPEILFALDVPNRLQTVDLTVHKTDEYDRPLEGISFEIYPVEDVVIRGKTLQKADVSLGTITTDAEGNARSTYTYTEDGSEQEFTETIWLYPNNKYRLVEISSNDLYEELVDPIVFEAASNSKETLTIPYTVNVKNIEKSGTVTVHKSTEGMINLGGIKMILSGTSDTGREIERTATTDKNGVATFDKIPVGTYTITEDKDTVPYAYLTAEPQKVEVFYAKTTDVKIINDEKEGTINLQKRTKDMTDLSGIKFTLGGKSDSGRDVSIKATTDKDGKAEFKGIPIGTYTITEDKDTVPYGYLTAEPQTVEVFYAKSTDVTFINNETEVEISKKSVTGDDELPGAKLQIIDKDGKIVEEWISGDKPHIVYGLGLGEKYKLKETIAPDGYVLASEIEFTVSGKDKIVMKDDTTKVKVSKRDITTDKELPGAKLQIIDKDGKIVEEWTSTSEAHYIEGKLIAGATYTLRETIAPDGYEIASDIKFTVKDDGTVTEVIMHDTHKNDDNVHTGTDVSMAVIFVFIPMLAAASILCKRRKN